MTLAIDTSKQLGLKTFETSEAVEIFLDTTTAYPTGGWPLADVELFDDQPGYNYMLCDNVLDATTPNTALVAKIRNDSGTKYLQLFQLSDGAEVGNATDVVLVAGRERLTLIRW